MKLLKNPIFWSVFSFLLGMFLLGIGHSKETSTIASRTHGGVFLMVLGGLLIAGGGLGIFSFGKWKR